MSSMRESASGELALLPPPLAGEGRGEGMQARILLPRPPPPPPPPPPGGGARRRPRANAHPPPPPARPPRRHTPPAPPPRSTAAPHRRRRGRPRGLPPVHIAQPRISSCHLRSPAGWWLSCFLRGPSSSLSPWELLDLSASR